MKQNPSGSVSFFKKKKKRDGADGVLLGPVAAQHSAEGVEGKER